MQVTAQLLVEVHVTTLPSPTVGPQSLTFKQLYVQWAPHVAAHVVVPVQLTVHSLPQVRVQPGPLMHSNMQLPPHVASQLLVKSLQVGVHIIASPQSRMAWSPHSGPMQEHDSSLHGTLTVLSLEHARSAAITAAGMARWSQRGDMVRC